MSEEQALEALFEADRSADPRDVADGTFDRRRALRLLRATFPARFTPVGPAIDIAYRLAEAGTIVALASNTSPLDFREVRRRYPDVIQPFGDRLFLSYRIGAMKPDAAFYRAILDSLDVSADECVFIDDKHENVAGAEAVGMRGLLFESAEDMDARLKRL
jgi:HAD superfamily hydrolase (TIGR01509 family)